MIRTFINIRNTSWNELVQVDTESGKIKYYSVDQEMGFPFSESYTTFSKMGYESIDEVINRFKARKEEIATDRQIAREIAGLLKLAKYRVNHGRYTCVVLDDGTKYHDITERLKSYGMTELEAVKKIDYFINYGLEQHNVKVTFENGKIETSINGTVEEIENYYRVGSIFNIGSVENDLQKVVNLEFVF